jgi:predicted nucleic acid-binding protein
MSIAVALARTLASDVPIRRVESDAEYASTIMEAILLADDAIMLALCRCAARKLKGPNRTTLLEMARVRAEELGL